MRKNFQDECRDFVVSVVRKKEAQARMDLPAHLQAKLEVVEV